MPTKLHIFNRCKIWHYIFFLPNQKPPFNRGLPQNTKPMKKENYAFRFTGFLDGVGGSTFFEGSLARGGIGYKVSTPRGVN